MDGMSRVTDSPVAFPKHTETIVFDLELVAFFVGIWRRSRAGRQLIRPGSSRWTNAVVGVDQMSSSTFNDGLRNTTMSWRKR